MQLMTGHILCDPVPSPVALMYTFKILAIDCCLAEGCKGICTDEAAGWGRGDRHDNAHTLINA